MNYKYKPGEIVGLLDMYGNDTGRKVKIIKGKPGMAGHGDTNPDNGYDVLDLDKGFQFTIEERRLYSLDRTKESDLIRRVEKLLNEAGIQIYNVEYNYGDGSPGLAIGHVKVRANSEEEALEKAEKYASNRHYRDDSYYIEDSCKIVKSGYSNDPIIESSQKSEDLSKHPKLKDVWSRWKFNTKYGLHYTSNAKDTQAYLAKITKPNTFWLEDEDTGEAIVQGTPKNLIDFMLKHKDKIDESTNKNESVTYHFSVEDIGISGNNWIFPEEAYKEAKSRLSKLGYKVSDLTDDLEFTVIGNSTEVAYDGVIYSKEDANESVPEENLDKIYKVLDYYMTKLGFNLVEDRKPYFINKKYIKADNTNYIHYIDFTPQMDNDQLKYEVRDEKGRQKLCKTYNILDAIDMNTSLKLIEFEMEGFE